MGSRDEYVEILKSAFVTISVKIVLAGITSAFPFFGSKFFIFLLDAIFRKFFNWFSNKSELSAFFYFIDTRVGKQGREFEDAAYKNREAQENGTKQQKIDAENNLWDKFKILVSLKS